MDCFTYFLCHPVRGAATNLSSLWAPGCHGLSYSIWANKIPLTFDAKPLHAANLFSFALPSPASLLPIFSMQFILPSEQTVSVRLLLLGLCGFIRGTNFFTSVDKVHKKRFENEQVFSWHHLGAKDCPELISHHARPSGLSLHLCCLVALTSAPKRYLHPANPGRTQKCSTSAECYQTSSSVIKMGSFPLLQVTALVFSPLCRGNRPRFPVLFILGLSGRFQGTEHSDTLLGFVRWGRSVRLPQITSLLLTDISYWPYF